MMFASKNYLFIFMLLILVTVSGCASVNSGGYNGTFTSKETPYSVELLEYADKENLTYIRLNTNRMNEFNEINLIEIKEGKESETKLYEPDNENAWIRELEVKGEWVKWIENYKRDGQHFSDIYAYDLVNDGILKIKSVQTDLNGGYVPINSTLSDQHIYWVEQDETKEMTTIKSFDLNKKTETDLITEPFLDEADGTNLRMPIFSLIAHDETLIYDLKTPKEYAYVFYNTETNEITRKVEFPVEEVFLCYSFDYDSDSNKLAVYFQKMNGDQYTDEVGYIDLKNRTYTNLLDINPRGDLLFNDRIEIHSGVITFNLEKYVTGNTYDNYIGYVYDTKDGENETYEGAFETKLTDGRITNLSFDPNRGINKVHLSIREN